MRQCLLASLVLVTAGAEVVRLEDGLFYHRGPYQAHQAHPQHLPHQALSVHPPRAAPQYQPRPRLPVRFPDAPAPVPQLQLARPSYSGYQPRPLLGAQPLLLPTTDAQPAPAPATQLQLSRPRYSSYQPRPLLGAQPLLPAPALTFLDPAPPPDQPPVESKRSAALDNLMAIAGRGRGLLQPEAGFVCPEAEGHFRSPSSCSAYYQCAQGKPHLRRCGPGLAYDEAR